MYANKSLARKFVFVFIRGRGIWGSKNQWGLCCRGTQKRINITNFFNFLVKILQEKDYNPENEYKIIYKKDLPKELRTPIIRQPFKGNPLKCINVQTNEEIIFNNKFEAIEQLGFTQSGIDKVLYGYRKSHKGYKFELLK